MKITLDGHSYEIKGGVTRTPIVEWPQNIRLDGQQRRKDRSYISSWSIDDWSGGLGLQRITNPDNSSQMNRIWDVQGIDTRWPQGLILSPDLYTCTIAPSRADLDFMFTFQNQIYFVESQRVGSAGPGAYALIPGYAYQFTSPQTIASYSAIGIVIGSNNAGGFNEVGSIRAVRSFSDRILALHHSRENSGAANHYISVFPTLGGSVTNELGQAVLLADGIKLGAQPMSRFAQIGDFGGTLHLQEYRNNVSRMGLWVANQDFGSLTCVASLRSVLGSYVSPIETDGVKVYAALPENIYNFTNNPRAEVDTSRFPDQNRIQIMHNNYLYFKQRLSLKQYDGTRLENVGYDRDDGLPQRLNGEITAMTSAPDWLFAAVKGATYSHILAKQADHGWQYYARVPSAGLIIRQLQLTSIPDGAERLWCLFDNFGYPCYFHNPLVNPLQTGTYLYHEGVSADEKSITFPKYGGGLDDIPGAFYEVTTTFDGMIAVIEAWRPSIGYFLDDGAIATLGIVATSGRTSMLFGSPYGLEGYRIQPRIAMKTNLAGTTPIFRGAVINFLKDPDKRETFDFTIDLKETSRFGGMPAEAIIATLSKIADSKILVPFQYGIVATKAVKVIEIPASEKVDNDQVLGGNREGFVRIRVAEII